MNVTLRRISTIMLEAGLLLGSIAALLYLVRMIVGSFARVDWYWGGAVASLLAPVAMAAALRLLAVSGRFEDVR